MTCIMHNRHAPLRCHLIPCSVLELPILSTILQDMTVATYKRPLSRDSLTDENPTKTRCLYQDNDLAEFYDDCCVAPDFTEQEKVDEVKTIKAIFHNTLEKDLEFLRDEPEAQVTFSVLNQTPQTSTKEGALDEQAAPEQAPELTGGVESNDEDYFDYESLSSTDNDSSAPSTPGEPEEAEDLSVKKHVPLCGYRDRHANLTLDTNFSKRRFQAAWSLVAPNIDASLRGAYLDKVMIAAASLNRTGLFKGLANKTMAPAPAIV